MICDGAIPGGPGRACVLTLAATLFALGCHNDISEINWKVPDAAPPQPTAYEHALALFGKDEACVQCMEDNCGEKAQACADDADCATEVDCRYRCDDAACNWDCRLPYPNELLPSDALVDCGVGPCLDECGIGRDFSCIEEYSWPNAERAGAMRWQFGLSEVPSFNHLGAGIDVRACQAGDVTCQRPADEGMTDDNGVANLELAASAGLTPFLGYIDFGDLDTMAPRLVPGLSFTSATYARPPTHPFYVPVYPTAFVESLPGLLGLPEEPDRGGFGIVLHDCRVLNHANAVGVSFELTCADEHTKVASFSAGAFSPDGQTTLLGAAAGYNLLPGQCTVTARREGTAVAEIFVHIRPNEVTYVNLFPRAVE